MRLEANQGAGAGEVRARRWLAPQAARVCKIVECWGLVFGEGQQPARHRGLPPVFAPAGVTHTRGQEQNRVPGAPQQRPYSDTSASHTQALQKLQALCACGRLLAEPCAGGARAAAAGVPAEAGGGVPALCAGDGGQGEEEVRPQPAPSCPRVHACSSAAALFVEAGEQGMTCHTCARTVSLPASMCCWEMGARQQQAMRLDNHLLQRRCPLGASSGQDVAHHSLRRSTRSVLQACP